MRTRTLLPATCRPLAIALLSGALLVTPAVSAQAATPSGSPQGHVDKFTVVAGGVRVQGWAWDPSTSRPVTVLATSGSKETTATATQDRPDVAAKVRGAGAERGFDTVLRTGPGQHKVCVTGIDVGKGSDARLSCETVLVPESSPFGNLDNLHAVEGGARVHGWAADLDTSKPLTVVITANGRTTEVTTGQNRPDVPRVWPGLSEDQGYETVVPLPRGKHSVCVTVRDVGPGSDTSYGCRTVTVAGAAASKPARNAEPTRKPVADRAAAAKPAPAPAPAPKPEPAPAPAPAPAPKPAPAPEPAPAPAQPVSKPVSGGKPGAGNTGVPSGKSLKRHDGDLVITTPGAVIDGLDVRGFVEVRASGVTIRNTVVRGASTNEYRALVRVDSSSHSVTVEDSELVAATASPYVDGLRGMNITARRVEVRNVIDSVHIYGSNVTIEDSWLHGNAYFAKDPLWNGGGSHNDNIQIQIGDNITIRNNTISGTKNAAVMLTQDRGTVSNVRIDNNFLDGGACVVNIKTMSSAPRNVALRDNTFGRNAQYPNCGIKVNPGYKLDLQRNVFTDGKAVPRTA